MPTRRQLELMVIVVLAMKPVTALGRLWAHKTLATQNAGPARAVAEVTTVVLSS